MDVLSSPRPSLARYIACLMYETLLVLACLFILGLIYAPIDAALHPEHQLHVPRGWERAVQGVWYLSGVAAYFVYFWSRRGQTLAMKTWRIKLVSLNGGPVSPLQAGARFVAAALAIPLFGIAWLWAFGSPQRLGLHDQLSKTMLIRV